MSQFIRRTTYSFIVLCALTVSNTVLHAEDSLKTSYTETFRQLMNLAPDSVANVEHLTISRDVGTFTMTEGELYLLTPVNGRTVGAYFTGTGTVDYVPPT